MAILAGGSLLGAGINFFGQRNQQQAAAAAQQESTQIARQQLQLQQAGQTDARGNAIRYVPGFGWVTEPTPTTRAILAGEDREKLLQLGQDAPLRREALQRGAQVGRELQPAIRGRIAALHGPRVDPERIAGETAMASGLAAKRGLDESQSAIGRVGVRTGNATSTGAALADLGQRRGETMRDTILQGIIQGRQLGQNMASTESQRRNTDVTSLISGVPQINAFTQTPSGPGTPGIPPTATGIDPSAAMYRANQLIPFSTINPYGAFQNIGMFGANLYDSILNDESLPRRASSVEIGPSTAVSTRRI